MGSRDTAPLILDLGNRWGVVNLTPPAALSPGKNTGTYWRGGRVDSKRQSGRFEEEKNIHHQRGLEAPTVQPQLVTHTKTLPNAVFMFSCFHRVSMIIKHFIIQLVQNT